MVVYTSPDIFQDKMSALMDNLEFVIVYPKKFLVVTLEPFKEHLAKV